MLLNNTAKLEFSVNAGTDVEFLAYAVNDSGIVVEPVFNSGQSNGGTAVDVVAAPASSNYRVIKWVEFTNTGSVARTLTVRVDVSGTDRNSMAVTLQAGEKLVYDGTYWKRVLPTFIAGSLAIMAGETVLMARHFATANLTGTKTITSGSTFAVYVGKAPRAVTSGKVGDIRWRVTTAAATITWAEVAIAKGSINVGGNPTLTAVGFADVSGVINSTGQKTTSVNLSAGQAVAEGDDIWVLIGNQATTAGIVRAQSIADDLQVGLQASLATRPSLNIGSGQAYTIESATTLAAWVALVV